MVGHAGMVPRWQISHVSRSLFRIQSDRKTLLEREEKLPKSPDEADALAMAVVAYQ